MADRPGPARPAPVKLSGADAAIDAGLWYEWRDALWAKNRLQQRADELEHQIRRAAGNATYLTVEGKRIAVRIIRTVENASWTSDYYRQLPGASGDRRG